MGREPSLAQLVDAISTRMASDEPISGSLRSRWTAQLLERQVDGGKQAGAFRPSSADFAEPARLFTGEVLRTKLATWTCLTAETARLLKLLGTSPETEAACDRAASWLAPQCFSVDDCIVGECAHSFIANLRFLNVTGSNDAAVTKGIGRIRQQRNEGGRWDRFPFYYTTLVLLEVRTDAARNELRFAMPALRRARGRRTRDPAYADRRLQLIDQATSLADLHLL